MSWAGRVIHHVKYVQFSQQATVNVRLRFLSEEPNE